MASLTSAQLDADHFEGGRNITPGNQTDQNNDLATKLNNLQTDVAAVNTEVGTLGGGGSTGFDTEGSTTGGKLELYEGTDNGTNKVTMQAPAALAADRTITVPDANVDLTNVRSAQEYADRVQSADVTITDVQLKALQATPIEVLPAPGAGKYYDIESIQQMLDFNSAAYVKATGGEVSYQWTGAAGVIATQAFAGLLDATADAHVSTKQDIESPQDNGIVINSAVDVANDGAGEWTTGDSPLKLRIRYRVLDALT